MVKFNEVAFEVLNIIKKEGYLAYLVGGCVRDYLLNKEPIDYDITTSASPSDILRIFSFTKTIPTGLKHGTVTVIYKHIPFEITTFRKEKDYLDNRHPLEVEFINNLKEDLERRDFTINALAYDDKIYDYFDGINDLHNKIIRTVGNSKQRFTEDALRILRAIRFSFRLNFTIEENTLKEIHNQKERLNNISIERIIQELIMILNYNSKKFIDEFFDLLIIIFPFLKLSDKPYLLENINNYNNDYNLVFARIFSLLEINKRNDILKKYHLPNKTIKLINLLNKSNLIKDKTLIELKKTLKKNSFNDIILYIRFNYDNKLDQEELIKLLEVANKECHNLKSLALNGSDLINLGITDGKMIKDTLDNLLNLVIEEKLPNDKQKLISYLKQNNYSLF